MRYLCVACVAGCCLAACFACGTAAAEDWPTYLRDAARSGVTQERLELPLHRTWTHVPRQAPRPAWPGPAKRDIWHEIRELSPVVTYDRAFHAVSVADAVYFGSSADDQVYCLDANTGEKRWSFFAEGPVRLAPTIANGLVYFTSDDGYAYCLRATDGALVWKHRPDAEDRRIPGNGRIISSVPSRTGVVVDNGVAYYFTGLFPPDDAYRCALDAATGTLVWCEKCADVSPQGYLLASPTRLFVPTGRTSPVMFDRQTGKGLGALEGPGGAYAVLVDDAVVSGPGRRQGAELGYADTSTHESVASFPGIRMVVSGDMAYLQSKEELSALNRTRYVAISRERNKFFKPLDDLKKQREAALRKSLQEVGRLNEEIKKVEQSIAELTKQMDACFVWKKPAADPYSMILASDVLFVGGEDKVTAVRTSDGAELWSGEAPGRAYGLSVANGTLLVSASDGSISCFVAGEAGPERVVKTETRPAPYPEDKLTPVYGAAADAILKHSDLKKGYCLVLGCGEGRLAYELARRTDLTIVGVERDAAKVAAARAALDAAGLYGVRVTVHHWEKDVLPFTSCLANLVVSEEALISGAVSIPAGEVLRVLRPCGGLACIGQPPIAAERCARLEPATLERWLKGADGTLEHKRGVWAVMRRGPIPGSGEWTQLYADANHTACSMDPLRGPMLIQWFGEPGPRDIIDRHHRPMSSLYKDGRVFVPGDNLVKTIDAYNGTPLWELEVPDSRRVASLKSGGHMVVTSDSLYVAVEDACWRVNPVTGEHVGTFKAPQLDKGLQPLADKEPHDWGYLDCVDNVLIGTGQKAHASFSELSKKMVDTIEGDFRPVIVSQYLFALNRHKGSKLWTYRGGTIMNNAIAIANGRVYLIESRNEKALANANGRLRIDQFCANDAFLVALDLKSGKKVWERPVTLPFHHIMYLNGADNALLASGSFNKGDQVWYALFVFDMADGKDKWNTEFRALDNRSKDFAAIDGSHGEQWQHPVIISGTIYARPFAYDLQTGAKKDYMAQRGGHGCGGLTGSAYYLYGRGSNPRMYPTETTSTEGVPLTLVSRPGCWLNIIPAGGLLLIPESSSGCTCAYPLQTSMALIPKQLSAGSTRSE